MRRGAVLVVSSLLFANSAVPAHAQPFPDETCFGKPWTILGTEGRDEIVGTQRPDVIVARGGHDLIDGAEGDDLICGGAGNDDIKGSEGDDRIDGGHDGGIYIGGPGDDRIQATGGSATTQIGGDGNDVLIGARVFDDLRGGAGADRLVGNGSLDLLFGGPGADHVNGGNGFDYSLHFGAPAGINADLSAGTIAGGHGPDRVADIEAVVGTRFEDSLFGNDEPLNALIALRGNDTINGRGGRDLVSPGPGDDILGGGNGERDLVSYAGLPEAVNVDLVIGTATGYGTDVLTGFEEIFGSDANDVLAGDANANVITGGIGADDIQGRAGDDRLLGEGFVVIFNNDGNRDDFLDGGDGTDTVSYATAERGVFIDLTNSEARGEGNDTLSSIENARGSSFGDTLIGDDGPNELFGRGGGDILDGAAGDDTLDGGPGSDRATGGAGNDTCTRSETRSGCESTTSTMRRHVVERASGRAVRAGLLGVRRRR